MAFMQNSWFFSISVANRAFGDEHDGFHDGSFVGQGFVRVVSGEERCRAFGVLLLLRLHLVFRLHVLSRWPTHDEFAVQRTHGGEPYIVCFSRWWILFDMNNGCPSESIFWLMARHFQKHPVKYYRFLSITFACNAQHAIRALKQRLHDLYL